MCEFKIINESDESQIAKDILVLFYTEDNELVFRDVLGMGEKLESALILDVNTVNQKCVVLQHPLIKDFIGLIKKVSNEKITIREIENFQNKLNAFKGWEIHWRLEHLNYYKSFFDSNFIDLLKKIYEYKEKLITRFIIIF